MSDVLTQYFLQQDGFFIESFGPSQDLFLALFVNNYTFIDTTAPVNLVGCTAPGYAAVHLLPGSWVQSSSWPTATFTYPSVLFTFTGPGSPGQTIYGWLYQWQLSPGLVSGGNLATPYVIPSGGGALLFQPKFTVGQCP